MASSAKGKEKVVDGGGKRRKTVAKRKINNNAAGDEEEARRKRNRTVLQFFEDTADVDDDDGNASEDSLFGDDFLDDVFDMGIGIGSGSGSKGLNETGKAPFVSFIPKEEQVTEEEFDKMLEERYKPGSNFATYAEDNYESKRSVETPVETSTYLPSGKDPVIWKVKCMVGRERHSAFCLMQKYVDLKYLGTKLHIISAVALDHVKGFIYIEAEKQQHIYEACNGLCTIYSSRVTPVPRDEISHLFSIRSIGTGITEGMWARVKSGTYKGDLAQVVAISNTRKKITVKLIPRVDLQALAEKFGRGITRHKADIPAPRLISSSELEEFRPLIQYRRDRDTNKIFEILDGMTLKDGYLYKKVSMDSLNFWGVTPKEDELLKFEPSKNDECNDLEWLTQLYGERKKKRPVISGKGNGKGEGSSSFSVENKFEVHDLVFFGGRKDRKDFGVIIGSEKDDSFKIIKEGSEGPVTVTLHARELKVAEFDKKLFTALDQKLKNISVNDAVRVLDGPLKDKQGVVKKIYGGVIFLFNEIEQENNGYMCTKARFCEKVEPTGGACNDKTGEPGSSAFGDFSSPKSPLSPEQSQQERGGCKFNRENDDTFSVGQLLRIRLGPLKGYLCRVLAVRRSDVTVKLDSQHKILTVKRDHVSEVRGRSSGISTGVDTDSVKPFDLLGEQDGSRDWMNGAATATATETEGGGWNLGLSTERSSVDEDGNKDNSSWGAKATPSEGSSWGAAGAALETATGNEEVAGWGGHKKAASTTGSGDGASASWGKAAESSHQTTDNSSWGAKATPSQGSSWGAAGAALESAAGNEEVAGWGGQKKAASSTGFGDGASDSWGKAAESCHQTTDNSSWGTKATPSQGSSLGAVGAALETVAGNKEVAGWGGQKKAASGTGFGDGASDQPEGSAWNKSTTVNEVQTNSWGTIKKDEGSTGGWGKNASTSDKNVEDEERVSTEENKNDAWGTSMDKNTGGGTASWSKQDGGSASWSKPDGGSSSWTKKDGGSSFNKGDGGASWNSTAGMRNEDGTDQQGSWGRQGAFDGGRGSGGRRGRGGGRGGRDQFGRGRSFGQDQTTNWKNGDQDDHGSSRRIFGENKSSWTGGQGGGWKEPSGSGEEKSDWNSKSSSWQNSESAQGWGTPKTSLDNNSGDVDNSGGGSWNSKKSSEGGSSSGWGQTKLDGTKDAGEGGSSSGWGQTKLASTKDAGENLGSWGASKSSTDKNTGTADNSGGGGWNSKKSYEAGSSSGWGQSNLDGKGDAGGNQGSWGASKDSVDKNTENADNGGGGGWNSKKSSEGGSSSGWGQSKWGGTTDAGGNQGSWGSKGNWSSEKNLGGSEEQTVTFGGRGGGSWRGGRGGRWGSDGGSFGDRGGSDRGGFRGRGGSDRGGFGGRGRSDRGDFGGRGRSDGGDFGGRGGFGGRGRGRRDDWNNNNESGDGGSSGWKSEGGAGGWSNSSGGRGRGRRDDWKNNNESGDGGSSGWKSEGGAGGWSNNGGGRGHGKDDWKNNNESGGGGSSGWKSEGAGGGWSNNGGSSGWKSEGAAGGGDRAQTGGWNKTSAWSSDAKDSGTTGGGGNWKSANSSGGTTSSSWNQSPACGVEGAAGSSWGKPNNESDKGSSLGQPNNESSKGSSWGQPNNESSKGSSWGQPGGGSSSGAGNSWDKPSDGSSKGGW